MNPLNALKFVGDIFRLPHRAPTGLVPIGNPDRTAPVLVTGNYSLTVRRLRSALRSRNAWLLCANSQGINVWCAAGGGHLTHHDIISVVRTSGIDERVDHRLLILPQLCATGVERSKITAATGWETRWGPARLEDLPGVLDRDLNVRMQERFMRFPLWERLEMAALWWMPLAIIGAAVLATFFGWIVAASGMLAVAADVFGLFMLLPWIHVQGQRRWLTFGGFAVAGFACGAFALWLFGSAYPNGILAVGAEITLGAAILSIDFAGTTPWYGSYINTWRNQANIELVDDRCTGAADCVLVCPKDVFKMDGPRRKVMVTRPDECIQCGACIVQCPTNALRFRYTDGRVVEAPTIRATRMNMLGRRTTAVVSRRP